MDKSLLSLAVAGILGGTSMSAGALLTTTTVLAFDPGIVGSTINDPAGAGPSWFSMLVGPSTIIYTGMQVGGDGGIHIGVTQDTNGHASHSGVNSDGTPIHSGVGGIDDEWQFYYNAGMHFTTVPVTVVSDFGNAKTLDFSGWNVTWNAISAINVGGGIQDCGTTTDGICIDPFSVDIGGTYDNGTGLATITCSNASCSASSTFTLTYNAIVPQADPSNFGGTPYGLQLSGNIPPHVPVPAAAWLFGSGLVGLVGVARRKKSKKA